MTTQAVAYYKHSSVRAIYIVSRTAIRSAMSIQTALACGVPPDGWTNTASSIRKGSGAIITTAAAFNQLLLKLTNVQIRCRKSSVQP